MSKPQTRIWFRLDTDLKMELEKQALAHGLSLQEYLQKNAEILKTQYPGRIHEETRVPVGYAPPQYNPYNSYYPPQSPYVTGYPHGAPDAMDALVNMMTKMTQIKMMQQFISGGLTPEAYVAAQKGGTKEDDFNFEKMMKMQMMQAQLEASRASAQAQLESARARGDKSGENTAAQTIAQIAALQSQQGQQFMQALVGMMTASNQTQSTLFNTALQTNRQAEQENLIRQQDTDLKMEGLRNQMFQNTMDLTGKMYNNEIGHIQTELERIRTEAAGKGDLLKQLNDLLTLRNSSPIYKAAFDQAFGVQNESTIGKLIPQLQALGIDKAIEKVLSIVAGAVVKPKATPTTLPPLPTEVPPPVTPMPSPTAIGNQPLESLRLPTPEQQQQSQAYSPLPQVQSRPKPLIAPTPSELTVPSDQAIGYTNISRPTEEIIPISPSPPPTIEETSEPEKYNPERPIKTGESPYNPKGFTVGRPKKKQQQ